MWSPCLCSCYDVLGLISPVTYAEKSYEQGMGFGQTAPKIVSDKARIIRVIDWDCNIKSMALDNPMLKKGNTC